MNLSPGLQAVSSTDTDETKQEKITKRKRLSLSLAPPPKKRVDWSHFPPLSSMFQCFWSCHYLAYFVTHLMDIRFAVDFFFWTLSGEANNQILGSFFNVSYWPGLSLVKIIKYYGCLNNKGGASQRAIVRPTAPKRAPPTPPTQGPITPQTQTHTYPNTLTR